MLTFAALSQVSWSVADFTGSATVKVVRKLAFSPSFALALVQIHCGAACNGAVMKRSAAARGGRKRRFMGGMERAGIKTETTACGKRFLGALAWPSAIS